MRKLMSTAAVLVTLITPAAAGEMCIVNDQTGTPLNVRAEPNGRILGALHNGVQVFIVNPRFYRNGTIWVYANAARSAGWVALQHLDCDYGPH